MGCKIQFYKNKEHEKFDVTDRNLTFAILTNFKMIIKSLLIVTKWNEH